MTAPEFKSWSPTGTIETTTSSREDVRSYNRATVPTQTYYLAFAGSRAEPERRGAECCLGCFASFDRARQELDRHRYGQWGQIGRLQFWPMGPATIEVATEFIRRDNREPWQEVLVGRHG